ncbi:MAG: hypothetical protein ACE5QV_09945, partial [Fidelibacterota bacterium]
DENNDHRWSGYRDEKGEGNFWLFFNGEEDRSMVIFRNIWGNDASSLDSLNFEQPVIPAGVSGEIKSHDNLVEYEMKIDMKESPLNAATGDTIGLYIFVIDRSADPADPVGEWPQWMMERGRGDWWNPKFYVDLILSKMTGVEEAEEANISDFHVKQNFPNPFNPITSIEYSLPIRLNVRIYVLNIMGERVNTLINELQRPGRYHVVWDGTNLLGREVSSGVYLCDIKAGNFRRKIKMLLIR